MLDRIFKSLLSLLALLLILWLVIKVASQLTFIVAMVGFSLLLTYMLLPVVDAMHRVYNDLFSRLAKRSGWAFLTTLVQDNWTRVLAIVKVYILLALLLLTMTLKFAPAVVVQFHQFSQDFPSYLIRLEEWTLEQPLIQHYFHNEVQTLADKGVVSRLITQKIASEKANQHLADNELSPTEKVIVKEKLFTLSEYTNQLLKQYTNSALGGLLKLVLTTLSGLLFILTSLVLVFYFLLDGAHLKHSFITALPVKMREQADFLMGQIHQSIFAFVKGQVLLGIATGVYMTILYVYFDIPYAFFLGTFFAFSEIIPVIGTWIGFTPGIIVALFTDPVKLLFLMALCYVFQVIKDNFVAPKVIGDNVNLHPVVVLLAILTGAQLGGFVGVLFAVPLASVVNVLIQYVKKLEAEAG